MLLASCGSGKKYKRCCEPLKAGTPLSTGQHTRKGPEPHFTVELSPKVEQETDQLLARLERGESQGVQARFQTLARQHPLHHLPQFGLGVYELLVNDSPAAAAPFFERAVEIFPYFAEAHFNLAGCATRQGDVRKAVESLRKTIDCSDDSGITSRARDDLKFLESLVTKEGSFTTLDDYIANQRLFDQAFDALSNKDFARAVEGFQKVLKQNPKHVQSYGNLGLAYAGMGKKAAALECLDKALALDPNYAPARSNRRLIATMEEGQAEAMTMAETRYYLQQHEAARGRQGSLWQKAKQFWRFAKGN